MSTKRASAYNPRKTDAAVKARKKHISTRSVSGAANYAEKILKSNKATIENNHEILTLFPELRQAAEIRTALILTPNTLATTRLNITIDVPHQLKNISQCFIKEVTNIIKRTKIREELDDIILDSLIGTGGTLKVILPQTVYDDFIYSVTPLSGNSKGSKLLRRIDKHNKKIIDNEVISLETNLDSFKEEALMHIEKESEQLSNITPSLENQQDPELYKTNYGILDVTNVDQSLLTTLRKNKTQAMNNKELIEQADIVKVTLPASLSGVVGETIVKTTKSHAITVIHHPGNKDKPIGYLIAMSGGHIVDEPSSKGQKHKLNNDDKRDRRLVMAANKLREMTKDTTDRHAQREIYKSFVKDHIKSAVSDLTNAEINIKNNPELYDLLLQNALKEVKTKLLYVPAAASVYFNLDTRKNGLGKTALESMSAILGQRAALQLSSTYAKVRYNTGLLDVNVDIGSKAPDVVKAIKDVMAAITTSNKTGLISGSTNIADLSDVIASSGVRVKFSGHPDLPNTKIDYDYVDLPIPTQDDETVKDLENKSILAMGISPNMMDEGFDSRFASDAQAKRDLILKSVIKPQLRINAMVTDFITKYIKLNGTIIQRQKTIIKDNLTEVKAAFKELGVNNIGDFKEEVLIDTVFMLLLNNLIISLPKVIGVSDNTNEAFDDYRDRVTSMVKEVYFTDPIIDSVVMSINEAINEANETDFEVTTEGVQDLIIAHFLKDWAVRNNYLPELSSLDTKAMGGLLGTTSVPVVRMINDIVTRFMKTQKKVVSKLTPKDEDDISDDNTDTAPDTQPTEGESTPDNKSDDTTGDTTAKNTDDNFDI